MNIKKKNLLKKSEIQEVLTYWQKLHKNFFVNALSTLFAKENCLLLEIFKQHKLGKCPVSTYLLRYVCSLLAN
jgi:uncharacterized protein YhfF